MTQHDEIERILASVAVPLREALDRARLNGRREALDIIKAKTSGGIFGLRFTPEGENEILGVPQEAAEALAERIEKIPPSGNLGVFGSTVISRVVPGTVRPAILAALSVSKGRRPSEITAITNLKENTVRGTLRSLGLEGIAVKRDDLWFLSETKETPGATAPGVF